MIIKLREEETLLQDGSTDTNDVELKHILFAHVNEHFLYGDGDMSSYAIDTDRNPWNLLIKFKKMKNWRDGDYYCKNTIWLLNRIKATIMS